MKSPKILKTRCINVIMSNKLLISNLQFGKNVYIIGIVLKYVYWGRVKWRK